MLTSGEGKKRILRIKLEVTPTREVYALQNMFQVAPRSTSHAPTRSSVACTNCRKKRVKCVTTEDPPRLPCKRCQMKNLDCKYVASIRHYQITDPDISQSSPGTGMNLPAVSGGSGYLSPPYPGHMLPTNRPPYTGGAHPDLHLPRAGQPSGYMQPQYTGALPANPTYRGSYHDNAYQMQVANAQARNHQMAPSQPSFNPDPTGSGYWQYPGASASGQYSGASAGGQYFGASAEGQYPSEYQGWPPGPYQ
ncbi:hypothetical protein GGX14DRAFT_652227 [Mycena pura]|uniref:Zn(2)-C6 fungal-type domain-containing protein n=1 Tax=Mycena pura TaxID=153505 RepID=A0AAD6V7V2_9AGAR|nr:hypothetical protein GGX14DRAFT_652227 [Mycena pura]